VSELDSSLFMNNPSSMTLRVVGISSSQRFETMLISAIAGIALFLTGLGLYATLAAMVAARSREIGLRMAVGAERKDVAMLVLSRAATLVLVGLSLGSAVALAASRSLQASDWWRPLLFGVSWFEPQTYFALLAVLGIVSLAACLLPTWRAMGVDPVRVLRDE
jgi:ABC-type antimicrobial peptide transport system permease subunit